MRSPFGAGFRIFYLTVAAHWRLAGRLFYAPAKHSL